MIILTLELAEGTPLVFTYDDTHTALADARDMVVTQSARRVTVYVEAGNGHTDQIFSATSPTWGLTV
jgi:hypothetical protein